ncbi:MAG: sigma-54-dependent Fis family transcriptional regulator [Deltaproteobacteria bacterium]|nr:MAG: sigma-54-dependent Fis family transcriptional regulator [Deltaproteobacteria bacterium]
MSSILIVDDEDKYLELCRRFLPEHDYLPPARNFREVEHVLDRARDAVDLVLLDVRFDLPEDELLPEDKAPLFASAPREQVIERLRRSQGLLILDRLRARHPDLPVIVLTSQQDLPIEADAERLRAEDYTYLLDDEYLDARSLRLQIDGILARGRQGVSDAEDAFYWGDTAAMQALRRRLEILARGRLPIILQGETGTGKSLLARSFVHRHSHRAGPFVTVDLSTIPTDLMAAHLFGVVRGAYTGATETRPGVLDRADGGVLFLDEIGNLGLEVQKQLLLVLQEGKFRPVGSVEEHSVDVKLVVATNRNLADLVATGAFREDLYMRLNPATAVTLPSLRARGDDFHALLRVFLRRVLSDTYNRDLLEQYVRRYDLDVDLADPAVTIAIGRSIPPARRDTLTFLFHRQSFDELLRFTWPGNFRQFEMFLSNLVTLTLVDLVEDSGDPSPTVAGGRPRTDVVPVQPRVVRELLRPMKGVGTGGREAGTEAGHTAADEVIVRIVPGRTLHDVAASVERQYLEALYMRHGGRLGEVAQALLADPNASRKVQLRMNQLGMRLRELKRRLPGGQDA